MKLAQSLIRLLLTASLALATGAALAGATPDEVIQSTSTALQTDISKNAKRYQSDKNAFYSMVDQQASGAFDTAYIAKVILGTHLKEASPEQVTQFEKAFKDMLIHNYADTLLQYYDSVEIQTKPARIEADGKRASVDATITRKDGKPPIAITFSMRDGGQGWKVWDIKAENISVVLNFRTQIDSEIKASNVASVIDRLNSGTLQIKSDDNKNASGSKS